MECTGKTLAYQLLGDPSSQPGCPNLREESPKHVGLTAIRQHNSSSLYKPPWRHSVPPSNRIGEGTMVMVPETENLFEGTAPSREGECSSRSGVPSNEGQIRLDVEPSDIQSVEEMAPDRYRSVCLTTDQSTTTILQLETRPVSHSDGCICTGLVKYQGICKSPWNLIGRVLSKLQEDRNTQLILITPLWPSQPWYPVVMDLLIDIPCLLPAVPDLILPVAEETSPEVTPKLVAWPISNNHTRHSAFQNQLRSSYWRHGEKSPPSRMTPILKNGLAGAKDGVPIPFRPL